MTCGAPGCRQSELQKTAWILFCCDNPPGKPFISGAQDAIGLVYPGLAKSNYAGEYWPHSIEQDLDEGSLRFVEELLYLVPLGRGRQEFDVLSDTRIDREGTRRLAEAAEACWDAIHARDKASFSQALRASLEAQVSMFPHMMTPVIAAVIEEYRAHALGGRSPARGRGYRIVVADGPVDHGFKFVARWAG